MVDSSVRDGVIQPSYRDFAPRVGIAYRLGADTVVRTGYGIFYAMHDGPDQFHISKNPGIGVTDLDELPRPAAATAAYVVR